MTQTVFLTIVILVVGLVLREQLYQIKQIVKKKEMQDICKYINQAEVYMRDKNNKSVDFSARISRHIYSKHDCIIIDID